MWLTFDLLPHLIEEEGGAEAQAQQVAEAEMHLIGKKGIVVIVKQVYTQKKNAGPNVGSLIGSSII